MPSFIRFALATAAILSFGTNPGLSMPTSSKAYASPGVKVLLRDENFAYHPSEDMAHIVKARDTNLSLEKRDSATVQACLTPSCTDCTTVYDSTFTTASACIAAVNTACLIVSNLNDANIEYWNHAGCNGNNSDYSGCPPGTNSVGAPGTNSIGVHPGC
ncbi:hypothetical protein DTO166G5_3369 [Paecilomyces variotii]|nr:hypothetical protein DTO166G5_3369 [Paecilomyces variotii]